MGTQASNYYALTATELAYLTAHHTYHENGGADEISVTGLSGLLADDQHVLDAEVVAVAISKDTMHANTILKADTDHTPVELALGASTIPARLAAGGIVAATPAQILAILTGTAGAAFDWNNQNLNNIKQVNLTDPTELTIASGAVTKTQGYHTIDTQSDASSDDLDTISGGGVGDILFLSAANDAREVVITRNGNIRFQPEHMLEVFSFASPSGASGTHYTGGYYDAPAADANLTQASTTQTYGTANSPYGAHAFLVAKQAGTTDAGTVSIVVSGTSITSAGVRAAGASETIVADITAMTANKYYETTKKWIGTITYTLTGAGGATTYAADFNYGFAAYDTFDDRLFTIKFMEVMGRAGANDAGFDMQLLGHNSTGWTYSAAAFVPGNTALCSLATDYSTESDLKINERFKYERALSTSVNGTAGEGFLVKVITTANKAVEFSNISIYAEVIPNDHHLKNTNQAIQMIFNGNYWMVV